MFKGISWPIVVIAVAGIVYYLLQKQKAASGGTGQFSFPNEISEFTTDITARAEAGELDPLIGREEEMERLVYILSRRTKNNPLLVGPAGVGKTAIVEGLAIKLATGDAPGELKGKRVIALELANLLAGTQYRGAFEAKVKKLLDFLMREKGRIVLFVDEIHTLASLQGAEGSVRLAETLKPILARGDVAFIGATTTGEYEKYLKIDEALSRRFQVVLIDEPSVEEAVQMLFGVKDEYENFHHVHFTDAAIRAAVRLSREYIRDRKLPDKAIDVIDEAGAKAKVDETRGDSATELLFSAAKKAASKVSPGDSVVEKLGRELVKIKQKIEGSRDASIVDGLRQKELAVVAAIEEREEKARGAAVRWPVVGMEEIREVVAEATGLGVKEIH